MESNTKYAGGALAERSTVVRLYNYEIRTATRYLRNVAKEDSWCLVRSSAS